MGEDLLLAKLEDRGINVKKNNLIKTNRIDEIISCLNKDMLVFCRQ